jgi:hypothetical protein
MTPDEAFRGYDALWRELKVVAAARRVRGVCGVDLSRTRAEIIAAMAEHADAAYALYAGQDDWRTAMWRRRAYLHRSGGTERVYDGIDAIEWQRAFDAGKVGVQPVGLRPGRTRMRTPG